MKRRRWRDRNRGLEVRGCGDRQLVDIAKSWECEVWDLAMIVKERFRSGNLQLASEAWLASSIAARLLVNMPTISRNKLDYRFKLTRSSIPISPASDVFAAYTLASYSTPWYCSLRCASH